MPAIFISYSHNQDNKIDDNELKEIKEQYMLQNINRNYIHKSITTLNEAIKKLEILRNLIENNFSNSYDLTISYEDRPGSVAYILIYTEIIDNNVVYYAPIKCKELFQQF